jgi:phosphohistidine phosphatase
VRLRKSVRGLARLGVRLDLVLTSPLTRTRQTADLVAAAFEPRPTVVAVEALAPSGTTQAVLADLAKHGKKESIAIIGHEPNIGELAARLVGARRPFQFKKGAVCRIDIDTLPPAGPGVLRWFLTPRILRSVGK